MKSLEFHRMHKKPTRLRLHIMGRFWRTLRVYREPFWAVLQICFRIPLWECPTLVQSLAHLLQQGYEPVVVKRCFVVVVVVVVSNSDAAHEIKSGNKHNQTCDGKCDFSERISIKIGMFFGLPLFGFAKYPPRNKMFVSG